MKRQPLVPLALFAALFFATLFVAPQLLAFDFGLDISDDSALTMESDTSVSQVNRARAWINIPMGKDANLQFSGFYEFKGIFEFSPISADITPARLDIDRAEYSGSMQGVYGPSSILRYSVGRFSLSDFSSRVLSGLSDGARADLVLGNLTWYATAGYRGLLYKGDARSSIDVDDAAIDNDDKAYFGPSRAFLGAGVRLTELLPGQDVGAEFWAQLDLAGSGTATHTAYFEPFIEGRVGRSIRWRAYGIGELGMGDSVFAAMAAGGMLRLSIPEVRNLRLTQSVAWASGKTGGLVAFTPIRQLPVGSASTFTFTDIVYASLDASLSIMPGVSGSAGGGALFRASDNQPSGTALREGSDADYLGAELNARASVRLSSDLSAGASAGLFIPETGSAYPEGTPLRFTASITATFTL